MAGSGWEVTGQLSNQVRNTPTNGTVEGTWIYFTTGDGNSGAVFVPDNIYLHKKKVHAMIAAQALLMDEIGNLSEPITQ